MGLIVKISLFSLVILLVPILGWSNELELLERVERLERIIQGQGLVSLLTRIERHQNEIHKLNGVTEILKHRLDEIQLRQSKLSLDIENQTKIGGVAVNEEVVKISKLPSVIGKNLKIKKMENDPIKIKDFVESDRTDIGGINLNDKIVNKDIPVLVDNGEVAYQSALHILRSGRYEEAAAALEAFPEQYPQSSYLPNAFYWQGETNYVLRNFDQAIEAFQIVINKFSTSNKVADAMLKQGFSQYELGQVSVAKKTLIAVMQKYPNTSVSRLAKARLSRIRRQIH